MADTPEDHALRILLVEDHWDIARFMVAMLESLGYRAVPAPTVAAAVAKAKSDDFDLLISDYSLPDGTGVDVLRQVKPLGMNKAILVTAYGKRFQSAAHEAGFSRYLEKPVEHDALAAAIKEVVEAPPAA